MSMISPEPAAVRALQETGNYQAAVNRLLSLCWTKQEAVAALRIAISGASSGRSNQTQHRGASNGRTRPRHHHGD